MKKYILVSNKDWQIDFFKKNLTSIDCEWYYISKSEHLTIENISKISPEKIFFTHWSNKITEDVYLKYECVLFHMTDLPYGRGGSPLQNLILNGKEKTKLSAIKVVGELDAGDVYLKKDLSLEGSASEIFKNAAELMAEMIKDIINNSPVPQPQTGEIVTFKRRKQEDGNLSKITDINLFYDYIRMLDAEGYPNAFIETEHMKIEFYSAKKNNDKTIIANVRITKK